MARELNDTEMYAHQMYAHQQRVFDLNKVKGWYDQPVSFLEAMALLITEADEAKGAFEESGVAHEFRSEIADIYIRLLDDCSRFHVDLATAVDVYRFPAKVIALNPVERALWLVISPTVKAVEAFRVNGLDYEDKAGSDIRRAFAEIYHGIETICRTYGVELANAFDLKMSVNWTRPYRHGGKHA